MNPDWNSLVKTRRIPVPLDKINGKLVKESAWLCDIESGQINGNSRTIKENSFHFPPPPATTWCCRATESIVDKWQFLFARFSGPLCALQEEQIERREKGKPWAGNQSHGYLTIKICENHEEPEGCGQPLNTCVGRAGRDSSVLLPAHKPKR